MTRTTDNKDAQAVILLRMADTRAALLAANKAPPSVPAVHGQRRSQATALMSALSETPRVTLLLALCVGAIVLGPRRTIGIMGRSGLTAWLAGTARKMASRAV